MIDFPVRPEARAPLESILRAGKFILEWTVEMKQRHLWEDKQKRAAVERQFEIIAEALYRLRILDKWTWGQLNDPETAMRLGDAIRRDYDSIYYGILIRATTNELPKLLQEVEQQLSKDMNGPQRKLTE